MVAYVYSVSGDIASQSVDLDSLERSIKESGISSAIYSGIRLDGDVLQIFFESSLSAGDLTTLNGIIYNHSGIGYTAEWSSIKNIFASDRNPAPTDDRYSSHALGSFWLNTITNDTYIIVDDTPNNAIWLQITNETHLSQILDGYLPDITGQQHYSDLSGAIIDIRKSLDGYVSSSSADTKVKVSSGDTTSGYLIEKLTEGPGITLTTKNAGGDEKLEASITPGILDGYGEASLPQPSCCGQVLYSVDGNSFTAQLPLTSTTSGWLVNDNGYLLVVG